MSDQEFLTTRFEEQRPRLQGVAYRMLGSRSEAEDAVQDVWMRLDRLRPRRDSRTSAAGSPP